jgi:N-acetylglucosamine-6-phosphate deacetylase
MVAAAEEAIAADRTIDGNGNLIIPGMIDLHIHGAEGHDMMDGTIASVEAVSSACAKTGCTSFLATSVSSPLSELLQMIDSVKSAAGREPGARIIGIHAEGPYLNVKRKGMQNEKFLRAPDLEEMETIRTAAAGLLKMVTLAPELPGGDILVRDLRRHGIVPALAHSDATYEQAKHAFRIGVNHVTHCCNGMRPMHHRDPGPVIAALEEPDVSIQAIVDGTHLHPAVVRLLYREKGPDKMALITDALQAMGMGDGVYLFGGHEVTVSGGVARLSNGSLASSTVTMIDSLKNAVKFGIPLYDAIRMATAAPADALSLPHKGRIEPGADADLVLLDEELNVLWTMVDGRIVYDRQQGIIPGSR